jgi:hypothetical protein
LLFFVASVACVQTAAVQKSGFRYRVLTLRRSGRRSLAQSK